MNKLSRLVIKITALFVICCLSLTSFLPYALVKQTLAASECGTPRSSVASASPSVWLTSRVGGVALDQAAKFLADMSDITGAYYDQNLDRIVFVGKKNTLAPKFDKDDLAVAIKTVIFTGTIPWVSLERNEPDDGNLTPIYQGDLVDTRFGKVMIDADIQLKIYARGQKADGSVFSSTVPGYKSFHNRYSEKGVEFGLNNATRFWLTPELITLSKDDANSAFVFETVKMQIRTEPISPENGPHWTAAANEFAAHMSQYYDLYAGESSIWAEAKQLGKIVSVVKWIKDHDIATDFHWARDYAPKIVKTPTSIPQFPPADFQTPYGTVSIRGGADFLTDNTYEQDTTGESSGIKTSSEAVPTTKEDIHWTFNKDGQQFEAVAVTADAFRSLGSYNTSQSDFSVPTSGDNNLTFNRTYSSYSGGQYGIGRGWSIYPAALMDIDPGFTASCLSTPFELGLQSQTGGWESFRYNCAAGQYLPLDPAYHSKILRNADGNYTVTLKDQSQLIFNSQFRLISLKDKAGATINYNYDGIGKLISISDSQSHQLTFSYGSNNLISEVTDWIGRKVSYTHDDQGNLLTVKDPNGNITKYEYDTNFKLIKITDRNGSVVLENTYTDEAKLAIQKDAAPITKTYSYDETNRVITVTDDQNRVSKTKYDSKGRALEQTDPLLNSVKYTYGVELAPLTITDKRGNKVTNTYDANGNVTTVTFPDNKKITFTYDSKNRITQISDARYSPSKLTKYTYDGAGNLTQLDEAGRITKFTYDQYGEMLTHTNPANQVTTWTRNSLGLPQTEKASIATDITNFEYDPVGMLTKKIDPESKSINYTYDFNGNLLTLVDSVGTTTNEYGKENHLIKTTLPDNTVTQYTYNVPGSLKSVKDALNSTTTYGYDVYQNLVIRKDALERETTSKYDQLNRQTEAKTPMGSIAKWEFDQNGNITKKIDPAGAATTFEYDVLNRLTKKTFPDGGTVTYEYDGRGNLAKMIDQTGTSTYTYNNFDERTKETNPYSSQLLFEYNPTSTVKKITYPDGRAVNYTYDAKNRLTQISDWNLKLTKYTYLKNNLVATRTLPNSIVTTYTYDGANRLTSLVHKKGTTTLAQHTYERDKMGNITKVTESGSFISIPSTINPTPAPTPLPSPLPVVSGPDLVITEFSMSPPNPGIGQNVTLSVKVKNQGSVAANAPSVRFSFYHDLEELPTYVTPFAYFDNLTVENLLPGEEKVFQYTTKVSARVGPHSFWAMVDTINQLGETNENNNASGPINYTVSATVPSPTPSATPTPTPSATPSPTPTPSASPTPTPTASPTPTPSSSPTPAPSGTDLVITNVILSPNPPTVGSSFNVIATVKNQGTVSTGSKFIKYAVYKDPAGAPTYSTTVNSSKTVYMSLGPGASTDISISTTLSTSGPHNIWVMADQSKAVTETDDNNNLYGPVATTLAYTPLESLFASLFSWVPVAEAQTAPLISTFTYDGLGRLKDASYPNNGKYNYTYDKAGNITKKTQDLADTYFYLDADDKVKQAGNTLYFYDKNGNIIRRTEGFLEDALFNFDPENRLTKYTSKNNLAYTFKYDGLGNKVQKYFEEVGDPNVVTRYVNDTTGDVSRLMAETGSSPSSVNAHYIYGLGPDSQGSTSISSRYYYLEDGMGNIRFLTNYSGSRSAYMDYDPYGNLWRSFSEGSSKITFKGEPVEEGIQEGLVYMRARFYDPKIGRFVSRDPLAGKLKAPQTQNPYAYAINNPINMSDPTGLITFGPCIGGSSSVSGAFASCTFCMVIDSKGIGTTKSVSNGVTSSVAGIGEFGGIQVSNAESIQELVGDSYVVGGSGKLGRGVAADLEFGNGQPTALTAGFAPGFEVSKAEIHAGKQQTEIIDYTYWYEMNPDYVAKSYGRGLGPEIMKQLRWNGVQ